MCGPTCRQISVTNCISIYFFDISFIYETTQQTDKIVSLGQMGAKSICILLKILQPYRLRNEALHILVVLDCRNDIFHQLAQD